MGCFGFVQHSQQDGHPSRRRCEAQNSVIGKLERWTLNLSINRADALDELNSLEDWSGSAKDFWPRYVAAVGRLLPASSILLFRERRRGYGKRFQEWSRDLRSKQPSSPEFNRQLLQQAETTVKDGQAILVLPSDTLSEWDHGKLAKHDASEARRSSGNLITAIVDAAPGTEASSPKH